MPRPILSVIGGLSIDTIHLVGELPEQGQMVNAEEFIEIGGRAANIAIAATRSCHPRPSTDDGLLPDTFPPGSYGGYYDDYSTDSTTPEVRIVAAVTPELHGQFASLMRRNGVSTDGLTEFRGNQSRVTSIVQKDSKRARQTVIGGVERYWTPEQFDTPEKLGAGKIPDLVVVTMELRREVVEQIILTAHTYRIDVVVYGSPAASLLTSLYPMVKHVILDEGDAGVILGYERGYVTIDRWNKICEDFCDEMGVPNVVLKLGPYGAYFKNEHEEGYASGYNKLEEVTDTTGSTAAFVGAYAIDYLRRTHRREPWSIQDSAIVGNKVCAFCVVDIGCINATPWATDLDEFRDQPLFNDLTLLRREVERRRAERGQV